MSRNDEMIFYRAIPNADICSVRDILINIRARRKCAGRASAGITNSLDTRNASNYAMREGEAAILEIRRTTSTYADVKKKST